MELVAIGMVTEEALLANPLTVGTGLMLLLFDGLLVTQEAACVAGLVGAKEGKSSSVRGRVFAVCAFTFQMNQIHISSTQSTKIFTEITGAFAILAGGSFGLIQLDCCWVTWCCDGVGARDGKSSELFSFKLALG